MKLALLVLAGCNAWFGNDPVLRIDAQYFDARLDAASKCPEFRDPPPMYGTSLYQEILQNCRDYTFNSNRASAVCDTPSGGLAVFEGPIDAPLTLVDALYEADLSIGYDQAALSSDAQTLYARRVSFQTGATEIRAARRQTDGTWQMLPAPALGQVPKDQLGTFARGPTGDHALIVAGDLLIHEWVESSDGWHEVRVHMLPNTRDVKMSSDGLRITLHNLDDEDRYSDRPDVDSLFETAKPFPTAPPSGVAPMMSEDCGRLYVTGLASVFYVQQ